MKFKEEIIKVSLILNELKIVHFLPEMNLSKEEETKEMTGKLVYDHFEKIDKSDAVLVVNPTGYFGNSVKTEIGYAKGAGKKVFFLEKTDLPELDCLADGFISVDNLNLLNDKDRCYI